MSSEKLAVELFNRGIPIFGEFPFKLHERYTKAPYFLMKLNLRKPPAGNLTDELLKKIAWEFIKIARNSDITYNAIAGLPRAGDSLAEAFLQNSFTPATLLCLEKQNVAPGRRKILPKITGKFKKEDEVLLVDDVISLADTKTEGIEALRAHKLNVTNCLVLMDWELGGREILADYGVNVKSVYMISCLLSIWLRNKLLTKEQCTAIIERKEEIREYIESH